MLENPLKTQSVDISWRRYQNPLKTNDKMMIPSHDVQILPLNQTTVGCLLVSLIHQDFNWYHLVRAMVHAAFAMLYQSFSDRSEAKPVTLGKRKLMGNVVKTKLFYDFGRKT